MLLQSSCEHTDISYPYEVIDMMSYVGIGIHSPRVNLSKRDESILCLFCVISIEQAVYDSVDLGAMSHGEWWRQNSTTLHGSEDAVSASDGSKHRSFSVRMTHQEKAHSSLTSEIRRERESGRPVEATASSDFS